MKSWLTSFVASSKRIKFAVSLFSLFSLLSSLFSVLCSLFSVLCSLFSVLCSLFSVLCSLLKICPCMKRGGNCVMRALMIGHHLDGVSFLVLCAVVISSDFRKMCNSFAVALRTAEKLERRCIFILSTRRGLIRFYAVYGLCVIRPAKYAYKGGAPRSSSLLRCFSVPEKFLEMTALSRSSVKRFSGRVALVV